MLFLISNIELISQVLSPIGFVRSVDEIILGWNEQLMHCWGAVSMLQEGRRSFPASTHVRCSSSVILKSRQVWLEPRQFIL
jgi:hypothetical protein